MSGPNRDLQLKLNVINEVRAAWGRRNAAVQISNLPPFAGRAALVWSHNEAATSHLKMANVWNARLSPDERIDIDSFHDQYKNILFSEDEYGVAIVVNPDFEQDGE